jgi:hypothetical protein
MSACSPGPTRVRPGAQRGDVARGGRRGRAGPGTRARRGGEDGAAWLSLLLLLAVVGGSYLAWTWAPVYFSHYEVKQIARDYMNQAVKDRHDEALVARMIERIKRVELLRQEGPDGRPENVPVIVVDPRDVSWERDTSTTPPVLRVSFSYERDVRYPLVDHTGTKVFTVDLENELAPADWGRLR